MKNLLTPLLYICVGALLSTMLTRSCSKQTEVLTEIVKTDTVIVAKVDTIVKIQPQPYRVELRDTVYISYPQYPQNPQYPQVFVQEIKEYKDSTYYARISGINVYLEEMRVYPKTITQYIYKTEKVIVEPKKLSLWASTELRKSGDKFSAPVSLEVRYSENGYEIFARGGYDLINNSEVIEAGAKRRF